MSTNDMWTTYANADREDQIIAAAEAILYRRLMRKGKISEPADTTRYLRAHLGARESEVFGVIFLDTRHQILAIEDMFFGSLSEASVYPREVVKAALKTNAASVIFYHNHPSGDPSASNADKALTDQLVRALKTVDVRVLDHFVITADRFEGFAAKGWI